MSRGPQKHSLTLRGHRTSVTLEPEFWQAFRQIAAEKNIPINVLAAHIDAMREVDTGLASAIRVYVLAYFRNPAAD
jgi:predicted DNA-binding ribbon-helix-helix protein